MDAVWGGGSAGSKDEAGTWIWQLPQAKGHFWGGYMGHPIINNGDCGVVV